MMAFCKQRVRYTHKLAKRGIQVQSQRPSHFDEEADVEAQHFKDAASGHYASHQIAGFGCNYCEELEEADQTINFRLTHFMSRAISVGSNNGLPKFRDIDLTIQLEGFAESGAKPPPPDYFLGCKSPGTQIWSCFRQVGLDTTRIYSIDPLIVMIKVRCPVDQMSNVAEVLRIMLKTWKGKYATYRESNLGLFWKLPCRNVHHILDKPTIIPNWAKFPPTLSTNEYSCLPFSGGPKFVNLY
jgi:hypothetical protein